MSAEAAAAREERADKMEGDPAAADAAAPPMTPREPDAAGAADAADPDDVAADEPAPAGPQGSIGIELGTDKMVVAASCVRRAATAVLVRNDVSNEAT